MIKFRLYYDKDAETKWLNQMAADGWAMKRFFAGFFDFEKCEKGEYVYQVDFGDKLFAVSSDYRELMQDAGIEIVQTWGYWVILRKKASEGKFELYTDIPSSIEHYKKIRRMFKVVAIVEMICMFAEFCVGTVTGYAFALLFAAVLVGLLNAVVRLNDTIADLEGRLAGIEKKCRNRNISSLMAVGLLMNSGALLLTDSVSHAITRPVQILAVIIMLAGLFQTCKHKT